MLKIHVVTPRSSAVDVLKTSDVIISINNKLIVCMNDIQEAVRESSSPAKNGIVEIVVLRKEKIKVLPSFRLQVVPTMFNHISAMWAGLYLEPVDDYFLDYLGFDPYPELGQNKPGIWIGNFKRGSPAARYQAFKTSSILFQVNDTPVGSIEDFLAVAKDFPQDSAVRMHFLMRNRTVKVATLRTDVVYWPTEVTIRHDDGTWENIVHNF
jgi:S1-C subfamily serine protease